MFSVKTRCYVFYRYNKFVPSLCKIFLARECQLWHSRTYEAQTSSDSIFNSNELSSMRVLPSLGNTCKGAYGINND